MKTLLILLLFSLSFCNIKKKTDKNSLYLMIYLNYQNSQCRNFYGNINSLFFSSEYMNKYIQNSSYLNSIIGDSSMDISSRYSGFLSSNTFSYAVSGNTLCDMLEQNNYLNKTYNNVIISTNGGNDLLNKVSNDRIIMTFKQLTESVKRTGKLTVIGIHPTRVDYANKNREYINTEIKKYTESVSNSCYIDPSSLFTLDSEGRTIQDQMLDSIHYSQTKSFEIKNLIKNSCNISL